MLLAVMIKLVGILLYLIKPAIAGCEAKSCGRVTNISHPFWLRDPRQPPCGGLSSFELSCEDGLPILVSSYNSSYYLHDIFYGNKSFWVRNKNFNDEGCAIPNYDIRVDLPGFFRVSAVNTELRFFYNCWAPPTIYTTRIDCAPNATFALVGGRYGDNSTSPPSPPNRCNTSRAPVLLRDGGRERSSTEDIKRLLKNGFLVEWGEVDACWECRLSNGRCSHDDASASFVCICPDGRHSPRNCRKGHFAKSIALGSVAGVVGLLLAFAAIFIYVRKRPNPWLRSRNTREGHGHDFLEKYESLVPQRYKYRYLKKITKSFSEKLGQGGFGSVFKGQLQDGRLVAVKILSRSKEDGEEFINEVASIGGTAHVNVVTLLGFCQEGQRRALVYEYMPNGSLERYIYSEPPETSLPWDKLYQIAIGIARGLEYLHQGCSTRIVHFDVKPHNILLDEDFCPKIADFGLAKLCHRKESILSMAEARGTIGYMAPEMFSRSFGAVSTKSDVYSYGTMVLEMVGGRKNIKARADDRTSDACFPHTIYQYLDGGEDNLRAGDVTAETEEIPRKMMLVGLWCIQTAPPNRPSMGRVVEMLEGSVGDIEMPPKPYLCTP